jgi:hypothetical protein
MCSSWTRICSRTAVGRRGWPSWSTTLEFSNTAPPIMLAYLVKVNPPAGRHRRTRALWAGATSNAAAHWRNASGASRLRSGTLVDGPKQRVRPSTIPNQPGSTTQSGPTRVNGVEWHADATLPGQATVPVQTAHASRLSALICKSDEGFNARSFFSVPYVAKANGRAQPRREIGGGPHSRNRTFRDIA